jgi:hypothetical protein
VPSAIVSVKRAGHHRNIPVLHVVGPSRNSGATGDAGSMSPGIVIGSAWEKRESDCADCSGRDNQRQLLRHVERRMPHASLMLAGSARFFLNETNKRSNKLDNSSV